MKYTFLKLGSFLCRNTMESYGCRGHDLIGHYIVSVKHNTKALLLLCPAFY